MEAGTSERVQLPAGTVTFLLGDVVHGASMPEIDPAGMSEAAARSCEVLEKSITRHGGARPLAPGNGGSVVGAFARPSDAIAAALAAQHELAGQDSPAGIEPSVRIALHAAEAPLTNEGDYFGQGVSRCSRLRAIAHGGQVLVSRAVHDLVVDALADGVTLLDLGTHRLGDLGRPEQVFALAHPGLPSEFADLRSLDALPNNLPDQLTSFVGREQELAEVRGLLAQTRLLTLSGAGGCGKTRLGLQAAADLLEHFSDGAWWVELAPLAEEQLVGEAISETLGVRPLPGMTALQAACAYLASRRALVILDNCEHLLAACGEAAAAIVESASDVTVLVTSRAPLGVAGETDCRVPSLSLPRWHAGERIEGLAQSDAVRLLIERAVSARPNFAMTEDNAPAVAQICTELDGIPLAIELAARRIRMLSVEQIAARLSDRFRLLTAGEQSALPRQQTLRASVEWSHELLSADERALLRRLSVFAGGFTLDAAEEVGAGEGIDRYTVLDLLGSLVDKSLVAVEERGPAMRYRLLETVRQYGRDRLGEAGEGDAVLDRHRDTFLALAERAAPHLQTSDQREWLELLDPEAANLSAAVDRAAETEPQQALRFCAALFMWWRARRPYAEVELAYSRCLAGSGEEPAALRATVLYGRGFNALAAGQFDAAREHTTQALALAEESGNHGAAALALCGLGMTEAYANPAGGRSTLARAAELARAAGDDWALVAVLECIAFSYLFQDQHAEARRTSDAGAAVLEGTGDVGHFAGRSLLVGSVALLNGRLAEARDVFERATPADGVVMDTVVATWINAQFGLLDIYGGEPERAVERLQAELQKAIDIGTALAIPALLAWTAWAELSSGRFEQARGRLEALIPIVDGRDCLLSVWSHWLLAETLRLLGDEGAEAEAERALAVGEEMGNRFGGTRGSLTLARLAAAREEWSTAERHALAHLDAVVEGGHASFIPVCLDALAEVAAGLESHEEAVRLFAAAAGARGDLGVARWTPEDEHWAAIEARLRQALGEDGFEAAWGAGSELTVDEAIGWARRARGSRKRPAGGWESLTPTEAQVVELVAQGLTNPEVGERMFISRSTVKVHLSHVFGKLGVRNRAELTAEVVRRKS